MGKAAQNFQKYSWLAERINLKIMGFRIDVECPTTLDSQETRDYEENLSRIVDEFHRVPESMSDEASDEHHVLDA